MKIFNNYLTVLLIGLIAGTFIPREGIFVFYIIVGILWFISFIMKVVDDHV